ncbi:MAG TPA: galactonate dehydratase, partial [Chloroflexota bacterium]|nr:galactonate dehydratase [Chloroflexota bacterium]
MKITAIDTLYVDGYYRNFVFVKMQTGDGLVGWGECSLEGKEAAVRGAVEDYARELIGSDPRRIERHLRTMTRDSFWMDGPVLRSAMGGLEMAMWDILGKSLGVPVHVLLGGRLADELETYSNAWYFGAREPEEFAAAARQVVALGYRALKFDPFGRASFAPSESEIERSVAIVAAVREAVGPQVGIALDAHGRFGLLGASRLVQRLAPYHLLFLEEPLHPHDAPALGELARGSAIPMALGERLYSRWDCRPVLEARQIALLQPDVIHVGGIAELRKIGAMAEAYSIGIAAHNAAGPISTAATLQVVACMPNVQIQEMFAPGDAPWKDELARPPIRVVQGRVQIPNGPGLGIAL